MDSSPALASQGSVASCTLGKRFGAIVHVVHIGLCNTLKLHHADMHHYKEMGAPYKVCTALLQTSTST